MSHENSPTPSQEEWDAQVAQIRNLTEERMIHHLSVGIMRRIPDPRGSRAKPQLGFFVDSDVVVMVIRPDSDRQRGVIHYIRKIKSIELNEKSIGVVKDQIKEVLADNPSSASTK